MRETFVTYKYIKQIQWSSFFYTASHENFKYIPRLRSSITFFFFFNFQLNTSSYYFKKPISTVGSAMDFLLLAN